MIFHYVRTLSCRIAITAIAIGWNIGSMAPAPLSAQGIQVASSFPAEAPYSVKQHRNTTRDPLASPLTIHLNSVPLRTALDAIIKQSGVRIVYSKAIVPMERRVSVHGDRVTLKDALQQALAGTGTAPTVTNDGDVVIARASALAGQAQGVITGKVVDAKTKRPVSGARVLLDDERTTVTTGEDGTFRLPAATGERTIQVRAVGYTRQLKRTVVPESGDVTIEIGLEPSASVLDEVVVTGSVVATARRELTNPITVITAEDIEKRAITRLDEFFRGEVPGVVVLEEGTGRYSDQPGSMETVRMYSRGVSGLTNSVTTPLKTFVDGVELLDPSYIGTIDPKSIERIEIITGPQAATVYGSGALGGVMQIFTKKGAQRNGADITAALRVGMLESNLSQGLTPTHNHSVSLSGGTGPGFSYTGTVSYTYTGQWQPGLFSRTIGASMGMSHTWGPLVVNGSVATRAGKNGSTPYSGSIMYGVMQRTGRWEFSSSTSQGVWLQEKIATSSAQTFGLTLDHRIRPYWSQQATVGRNITNFSNVPERPAYIVAGSASDTLYTSASSMGQRTSLSYNTSVQHVLTYFSSALTIGANGSYGDQFQMSGCLANASATTWIDCYGGNAGPTVNKAMNDESWGFFGNWRVGVFNALYMTFGIRGEKNPRYGARYKVDWTPTNGLTYTFDYKDMTVKLLGSYGRATRAPVEGQRSEILQNLPGWMPQQIVQQAANTMLTPEYSRGPQGGIEVYYGNRGSLTLNHYAQRVTDLIQSNTVFDSVLTVQVSSGTEQWRKIRQYQNVAEVKQYGWESTGSVNLGAVTARGTYSWSDSRITKSNRAGFVPGQTFVNIPTHTASGTIGYARGPLSLSVVANYIGTMRTDYAAEAWNLDTFNGRLKMYMERSVRITVNNLYRGTSSSYVKANLSGSYRLNNQVTGTLNVVNIGNGYGTDQVNRTYYATLGRQTQIGISWRGGAGR